MVVCAGVGRLAVDVGRADAVVDRGVGRQRGIAGALPCSSRWRRSWWRTVIPGATDVAAVSATQVAPLSRLRSIRKPASLSEASIQSRRDRGVGQRGALATRFVGAAGTPTTRETSFTFDRRHRNPPRPRSCSARRGAATGVDVAGGCGVEELTEIGQRVADRARTVRCCRWPARRPAGRRTCTRWPRCRVLQPSVAPRHRTDGGVEHRSRRCRLVGVEDDGRMKSFSSWPRMWQCQTYSQP